MMKRTGRATTIVAALLAVAASSRADETTFCNAFVTALPFTITTQGHYCFDRNLSTALTKGNAITIDSDFVVLDLESFKLGGGAAGVQTETVGIYSQNHRNITIRNGNIRGFKYGIRIDGFDAGSGAYLVENNHLDNNTFAGIDVVGDGISIRDNILDNATTSYGYGILAAGAPLTANASLVRGNVIVARPQTAGPGLTGIRQEDADGQADHNLVVLQPITGTQSATYGIWGGLCRDNTVVGASTANALFQCRDLGGNYTQP